MIKTIELYRLTQKYGAWGYGIYSRAEELIFSNGGSCGLGELTATLATELCEKVEKVTFFITDSGLFKIEENEVRLKRSKRVAGGLDPTEDEDFVQAWNAYGKKVARANALRAWNRLTDEEKAIAKEHIPHFVEGTPQLQFRPYLATYLNQHRFLEPVLNRDGEIIYDPKGSTQNTTATTLFGFQG